MREDEPIFTPGATEVLDDGPSWGAIVALGSIGIVVVVVLLLLV